MLWVRGGRYDKLIANLGGPEDKGACGFAFGIERMLLALEKEGVFEDKRVQNQYRIRPIYLCFLGENSTLKKEALCIQNELRDQNYCVEELILSEKPLKKHLQQANRMNARWALILGEDELKQGTISVKDMDTGTQDQVKLGEIGAHLKGKYEKEPI